MSENESRSIQKQVLSTALIFLVALLWYGQLIAAYPGIVLRGNEVAHVKTLDGMAHRGRFDIHPARTDVSCVNDSCYSNKPPGFPVAMLPGYLFLEFLNGPGMLNPYLFARGFNALCSALIAVLLFNYLQRRGVSERAAIFGVLAATFGTIYPAYGSIGTSHPLSILLIVLVMCCWDGYADSRRSAAEAGAPPRESKADLSVRSFAWFLGAIFLTAYAVTVDYSNAFFLLCFVPLFACACIKDWRLFFAGALGSTPLIALMWYQNEIFGGPFVPTYAYYQPGGYVPWEGVESSMSLSNVPSGLVKLLFSPARGLLVLSPIVALGLGVIFFARERSRSRMILWISSSGILIWSAYTMWHGGHSVGHRHILPAALLLAAASAFIYDSLDSGRRRWAAGLLLVSCASGVLSYSIQTNKRLLKTTWLEEPKDVHANYYSELVWPVLQERLGSSSAHADDSSP